MVLLGVVCDNVCAAWLLFVLFYGIYACQIRLNGNGDEISVVLWDGNGKSCVGSVNY